MVIEFKLHGDFLLMLHDDDMPLLLSSRDTLQHKQTELFYFEVNVCGVLKSTEALLFVLYSGTRQLS